MSIYRFGPEFHLSRVARILWSPIPSILFLYIIYMESPEFLRKDPNSLQYWAEECPGTWSQTWVNRDRRAGRFSGKGEQGQTAGEERRVEVKKGGTSALQGSYRLDKGHIGLVPDSFSSLGSLFTFIFCICVWLTHLPTRWDDIYAH